MADYEVRKKRVEPLWDRIDRNRIELALFVLLFFVSTLVTLGAGVVSAVIWTLFAAVGLLPGTPTAQ